MNDQALQQDFELLTEGRKSQPIPETIQYVNKENIFIEEGAFSTADAQLHLQLAKDLGFQLTVHADQFSTAGSQVAIDCGAHSADHLEASGKKQIQALAASDNDWR